MKQIDNYSIITAADCTGHGVPGAFMSMLGASLLNEIINEFSLVYDSIGIPVDEINAYNYFIKWFDTFIDGSHFIKTSYDNIVKTFTKEISKTKDKIFTNRKIDKFIIEDGTIKMVIESEGNEITARNYVINMRIDHFVDEYMPENIEMKANFYQTFSTVEKGRFINQLYIGTSKSPEELGITEKHYLFSEIPDDEVRLLSVVNYKLIDNKSCADGKGAILIEFLDDNSKRSEKEKQVLKQLQDITDFSSLNIETLLKEWMTTNEIGMGKVMQPLRLSLVGALKGPHLFDIIELIGKEETVSRIEKAITSL